MASMFRVGLKWINLGMVTEIAEWPPVDWGTAQEDEKRPRIYVTLLGNGGVEVTERDAVAAGYADMVACEAALIAALDKHNG